MNVRPCQYYIVLCICLNFQVMCVTSLPQLLVTVKHSVMNKYSTNYTNAISPSHVDKQKLTGCLDECQILNVISKNKSIKTINTLNTRIERSVKDQLPLNVVVNQSSQDFDSFRVFKYIHYDEFNPSTEKTISETLEEIISTTTPAPTTTADRSLIPNSFFSSKDTPIKLVETTIALNISNKENNKFEFSNKSGLPNAILTKTIVIDGKDVSTAAQMASVSERPRRSPYKSPPPRAALHRLPPRPILMPQPLPPPAPIPIPLPYTQNTPAFDFGDYPQYGSSNYGTVLGPPQEEQSINFSRFKKPPPPNSSRRMPPPGHRGRRPPPRPRQRPLPRPRPGGPRGRHPRPNKPQYSYPKNAANIQDILNYFDENDNEVKHLDSHLKPPSLPAADLSGVSVGGGSDFSKELHDVQTSLLKDIREFAQRPSLLGSSAPSSQLNLPIPSGNFGDSVSQHSKNYYKPEQSHYNNDFSYDEQKDKPVRDMIKYNQKLRDRESEELNSNSNSYHGKKGNRYKYSDKVRGGNPYSTRDESRERYHSYKEKESEEKQNYQDHDSDERELFNHREKERKHRPKYSSSSSSRNKYKDIDENKNSNEERDRYRERDRDRTHSHSNPYKRPSNHPIILKRPYGTYKPEENDSEETQKKRHPSDYHYHQQNDRHYHRDPYASVPRVKPISITYRPSQKSYFSEREPASANIQQIPNSSPEYTEDILEIHTNSPYRVDMKAREEKERRAHLQKLYLEYLERKMEAEAALTSTIQPTKKQPMRMKIHIYPNENLQQSEQTKNINYFSTPPHSEYSHHQPILSLPSRDESQIYSSYKNSNNQRMSQPQPTGNTGFGSLLQSTGPQMMVDKNKNVVLHLHVHRRNGFGEMEAGSEIFTSTVKPLSYKEIYDDHQLQQKSHQNPSEGIEHDNKSVSMELPIRDDKIEDVLHTLLQLRQR